MAGMKEKKRDWIKNLIIDNAWAVIRQKGFRNASVEEIAAKSEVSVGTVYNYFDSKNGLLVAIIERDMKALLEKSERTVRTPGKDPVEAIFRTIWGYQEHMATAYPKDIMREVFASSFAEKKALGDEMMRFDYMLIGQIIELIKKLQARGDLNGEISPESGAMVLYSVAGFSMAMFTMADEFPVEALKKQFRESLRTVFQGWRA